MPQHRRGRIAGTENYSKEDLTALLDESARVLPTGANEWDMVLENYLIYAERTHRAVRGVTSIKKKFQALLNCSKPTGGASCPDYVRRNNDEATPASANSAPQRQASTEETAATFGLTPTSPPADRNAASRPPPRDASVSAVSAREGRAHRLQNQILSTSDEFPMLHLLNHAPSEQ
ncbi:hypothetical protein PF005_g22038 [Phytophthora fragariae]|uniref:Uncharacterized protein n=1 Tax=Phytophthora fragariae TaxID=53985 RepID=A0A6A3QJW3_9STRA|nr:hypothetical protein PF003_g40457 [Phytophthora fragariae]KAE8925300.1 hypothetical protein PF009_g24489 [Phytophthora fragariae]KAE8979196.1 hypothetical protein PF011_g22948 [Phytophthora fragariae]KAE9077373.1 hypothetical protein PF007_g24268 [Phytophthora fragariae]KAE9077733.1 hypothetical protein PF010_g23402 [Phytophthora fragariae]